jgi:hypothetical protein
MNSLTDRWKSPEQYCTISPKRTGWAQARRRAGHPGSIWFIIVQELVFMNRTMRGMFAVALSASALTIIAGGWPLLAQESKQAKAQPKAKAAKKPVDPSRRVPNYFGQLGLTDEQKESIYKIQAKHQPRIEALEKQLDEIRAQSLKECEAALTDTQRKMLAERRTIAAEARTKKAAAAKSDN